MKWREAKAVGEQLLAKAGIPDPETDAWLLLSFFGEISRSLYLMDQNEEIPEDREARYMEKIHERCKRIPLQHLTGEQEFMGYRFEVTKDVLIPRQDTEVLVEEALLRAPKGADVLDLCTGSGCIAISLKKERQDLCVCASDLSGKALTVAKRNAKLQKAEVTFFEGDLFEPVEGWFDLIVSNPPYIPTADIFDLQEEVRDHDPFLALDGKEDGLFFYRKIISESGNYLKTGGWLMFEIGSDQGADVSEGMKRAGFEEVQVIKDLAGLDRVVLGRFPDQEKRTG